MIELKNSLSKSTDIVREQIKLGKLNKFIESSIKNNNYLKYIYFNFEKNKFTSEGEEGKTILLLDDVSILGYVIKIQIPLKSFEDDFNSNLIDDEFDKFGSYTEYETALKNYIWYAYNFKYDEELNVYTDQFIIHNKSIAGLNDYEINEYINDEISDFIRNLDIFNLDHYSASYSDLEIVIDDYENIILENINNISTEITEAIINNDYSEIQKKFTSYDLPISMFEGDQVVYLTVLNDKYTDPFILKYINDNLDLYSLRLVYFGKKVSTEMICKYLTNYCSDELYVDFVKNIYTSDRKKANTKMLAYNLNLFDSEFIKEFIKYNLFIKDQLNYELYAFIKNNGNTNCLPIIKYDEDTKLDFGSIVYYVDDEIFLERSNYEIFEKIYMSEKIYTKLKELNEVNNKYLSLTTPDTSLHNTLIELKDRYESDIKNSIVCELEFNNEIILFQD